MKRNAVVLLSGGLDSATTLAMARREGFNCYALSFEYGQRHHLELNCANRVAHFMGVQQHKTIPLDLSLIGGSALTDSSIEVPTEPSEGIPITYVPARNTVFLSIALGWAEVINSQDIFIGVNAVDYSGYPDCRPEYIKAYETMANLATKAGVEGKPFTIHTPLIKLTKAEIIQKGIALGVDYAMTMSCYNPDEHGNACGVCDSCRIRADGFKQANVDDPTHYVNSRN
jgi:7-cyano-7-deazaguanine synthase